MAGESFQMHGHEACIHEHQHMHVTHHAKGGNPEGIEHLAATHSHPHNHSQLDHAHAPHENPQREHEDENHIHDHSHPTEDR